MDKSRSFSVAVASGDRSFLTRLQEQLIGRPEWGIQLSLITGDPGTLLNNLHRYQVDAFLLDVDLPGGIEHTLQQLYAAGCKEFVFVAQAPSGPAAQRWLPWGEVLGKDAPPLSLSLALLRFKKADATLPAPGSGEGTATIVVHGPKGGCGKSLIATSLALQYAAAGKRTLLIDLAQYGSIGPLLGLTTRGSGLGAVAEATGRDPTIAFREELRSLLLGAITQVPVDTRTLDVLVAGPPLKMARLGLHESEQGLRVLQNAGYDVIVTDTSAEVSERLGVVLKLSQWVLLVSGTEVTDAWALVQMQDLLRNLAPEGAPGKIVLVLNRCAAKTSTAEFAALVGYPVAATIPQVERPLDHIAPYSFSTRRSPFDRSLRKLAQQFLPIYPGSLLQRWLKGGATHG